MGQAPRSRIPLIIGGVVVIIVIIAIIFSIASCGSDQNDVQNIPVTGIEENQDGADAEQTQPAAVAPTDFTLSYEVADGKSAYIEVIVDGSTKEAGDVSGPSSQTYTSSGNIKFVTSNPENLILKVDGEEQTLEANSRGVASVTFNFNEILNKWYADHPEVQKPATMGSSSTATTTPTSTGSSQSGSSASGGSSSSSSSSGSSGSDSSSGSSSN